MKTLWTIGYEGHTPESLVGRLRKAKVARVADIRELPLSRKPGFSKSSLAVGLASADIAYVHLRPLGTPRAMRHQYRADSDVAAFHEAYRAHLATQAAALDELDRLAREKATAILCVEAEEAGCHRHVVAEALRRRGFRIVHL